MNKIVSSVFLCIFLLITTLARAQSVPDIIFTQIPVDEVQFTAPRDQAFSPAKRYTKNCRIVSLISSAAEPTNLTPEFYSASDPDVSFDGQYIIFSGRQKAKDYWQIWKMKIDGSEKIQITKEAGDCIMPVYAGNRFYLNDPKPTPQIIYSGTAHNWKNNLESGPVYSLYATDALGKTIRRLTFNLYSDFSPDVLPNGRIVFSSLQLSGKENIPRGKLSLFAINNDGTDLMTFYGNHVKPVYKNGNHISDYDHRIYFIESDKPDMLGGGDIAYLSQRRPLHSYQKITRTANGTYHSPCPLPDGGLLASFRQNQPDNAYALYRFDPETGEQVEQILETPGWHCLDAQIRAPHPMVKGRSNWLIPGAATGVFYCLNSYQTNFIRNEEIKSGDFKYVRIIEGLPGIKKGPPGSAADTWSEGLIQSTPVRIVGVAPVEPDGSFHVRVPAKIPLTFQLLDDHQMTIARQNTWTWVMGNENRGCIGCHEDRELSPVNALVAAVTKPPVELTAGIDERRTIDFRHQIAPLIIAKCATPQCHVTGKATPNLEHKQAQLNSVEVYKSLLRSVAGRAGEYYIVPGYAKRSPLVWHLFGRRLTNGNTNYTGVVAQMPPKYPLSDEEKLLFIEWIDLGARWNVLHAEDENSKSSQK